MNHPTWEDFHRLESRQKQLEEEIHKLKEQRTDEMKAINVNVGSADVLTRLDGLEQKIDTVQEDTNRVTIQMKGARADISQLKESQADLRDRLIDHGKHLEAIREDIDTQKTTLGDLLNYAEKHDKILETVATKDDISGLKTDISSMKSTQEHILKLLQERNN